MTVVDSDLAALDPDAADSSIPALVARRLTGRYVVDEWGFDHDLALVAAPLARLRWSVEVDGAPSVPEVGPALIVHSRGFDPGEPLLVASALARVTGRPVRFSGVPDLVPIGPALRRIGGVPRGDDDLRSLLRSGELVTVPLGRSRRHPFQAGAADPGRLAVALAAEAPILPVAVSGFGPGRRRVVVVGRPISTRRRRDVVAADELADVVRTGVQELLTAARRR